MNYHRGNRSVGSHTQVPYCTGTSYFRQGCVLQSYVVNVGWLTELTDCDIVVDHGVYCLIFDISSD